MPPQQESTLFKSFVMTKLPNKAERFRYYEISLTRLLDLYVNPLEYCILLQMYRSSNRNVFSKNRNYIAKKLEIDHKTVTKNIQLLIEKEHLSVWAENEFLLNPDLDERLFKNANEKYTKWYPVHAKENGISINNYRVIYLNYLLNRRKINRHATTQSQAKMLGLQIRLINRGKTEGEKKGLLYFENGLHYPTEKLINFYEIEAKA